MGQKINWILGLWLTIGLFLFILAIKGLGNALIPLSLSILLSYLLFPLIWALEKKGVNRNFSAIAVFAGALSLLILFSFLAIPSLARETKQLVLELPEILDNALERIEVLLKQVGFILPRQRRDLIAYVRSYTNNLSQGHWGLITTYIQNSFSSIVSSLIFLLNFLLIPVFTFHLLKNYEGIMGNIQSLIPLRWQPLMRDFFLKANTIISGHIRGQIMVASILAILYCIGFNLIGLRFGTLVGLVTGLLYVIPYVGTFISFSLALLMALPNFSGALFLGIVCVFLLLLVLDAVFITPMILGKRVGLGILEIILSIIIGGNLGGIIGMMVAVPCTAVLKIIFVEVSYNYKKSSFYNKSSNLLSDKLNLTADKAGQATEVHSSFQ